MRSRVIISLCILFFLPSCIKKVELSSADESYWLMVMEDVYVAKAASQRYFGVEKDSMYSYHLNEVLNKYDLDSLALDSFMNYMVEHSIMQEFFDKLMDRVEEREDSLNLPDIKKKSRE